MIELSLELGKTLDELKGAMTTQELNYYRLYAAKRLLPTRRLQFYLANIARLLASDGKLSDFMLFDSIGEQEAKRVQRETATAESAGAALAAVSGAKVVKLGLVKPITGAKNAG